jgi:hypothetical protein
MTIELNNSTRAEVMPSVRNSLLITQVRDLISYKPGSEPQAHPHSVILEKEAAHKLMTFLQQVFSEEVAVTIEGEGK